jgi:hypothetical protein
MNMNKKKKMDAYNMFLLLFNQKYLQKPPTKLVGLSVGNSP